MGRVDDATESALRITRRLAIPDSELRWRFTGPGGPGGQHANKAATRVELTFDAAASPSRLPRQRERVVERLGAVVRVVVDDERSQLRNRTIAEERFVARLAAALHVEAPRRKTKPSKGAKERRLQGKKQRSQTKADRRRPTADG